jgi:hypothetical protein
MAPPVVEVRSWPSTVGQPGAARQPPRARGTRVASKSSRRPIDTVRRPGRTGSRTVLLQAAPDAAIGGATGLPASCAWGFNNLQTSARSE